MTKIATGALIALICASGLSAQRITAPPGFENREAPSQSFTFQPFGVTTSGRHQYHYADMGPPASFRTLELRRDGVYAVNPTFGARTVTIEIVMAHSDFANISTTFAANYKTPAAIVFSTKAVNVPGHENPPVFPPAPWTVSIPLDTAFAFNGSDALVVEIVTTANSNPTDYCVDGVQDLAAGAGWFQYLDRAAQCQTPNGLFSIFGRVPTADATGTVAWETYATRGPSNAPAFLAIGASDPNLSGVFCVPLRTSANIVLPYVTDGAGSIGSSTALLRFTFPEVGHALVFSQFAAVDPVSGGVFLTDGVVSGLVPYGPPLRVRRISANSNAQALTGSSSPALVLLFGLK